MWICCRISVKLKYVSYVRCFSCLRFQRHEKTLCFFLVMEVLLIHFASLASYYETIWCISDAESYCLIFNVIYLTPKVFLWSEYIPYGSCLCDVLHGHQLLVQPINCGWITPMAIILWWFTFSFFLLLPNNDWWWHSAFYWAFWSSY